MNGHSVMNARRLFVLAKPLYGLSSHSLTLLFLLAMSTVVVAETRGDGLAADEVMQIDAMNRFTFEELSLPGGERMGLLGGNFLVRNRQTYVGLGIYGAVTGERGGFFTGGFELGREACFSTRWCGDVGFFAGGGGGGAAPQGGGLMLRPHADLWYRQDRNRWGLGFSQVRFPNGDIKSSQWAVSYQHEFSQFIQAGWPSSGNGVTHKLRGWLKPRQFALQATRYSPNPGQRGRSGKVLTRDMQVIGIRWRQRIVNRWWKEFETGGAWGGEIDGFAQVLAGLEYLYPLSRRWDVSAGAKLGAAGGGDVDTGGGVIGRLFAGVQYRFTQQWSAQAELGATRAFEGDFAARTAALSIFYRYQTLAPQPDVAKLTPVRWKRHRIRSGLQRYSLAGTEGRKSPQHISGPVDLVALKLDSFVNSRVFMTGQALGAYDGGAGGYAVGLVGAGLNLPVPGISRFHYGGELLLGAAGGGGLAVGSGLMFQPMINFGILLNKQFGLESGFGYTVAPDGELESGVLELSLVYQFAVPQVRADRY